MTQLEESEQIAIMQWAELARGKYPALKWLHHIPNGGQRSKATAARLKAAGVPVKSGILTKEELADNLCELLQKS